MAQVATNGIKIEYEISGPAQGEPLVMIHGFGAQLIQWPDAFCAALIARGFRLIRFDNRDVGLSTHLDGVPIPDIPAVIAAQARGETPDLPYSVADMADDAAGLMAALGIESAHILGASLGGYISQMLAINHPERIRTLNLMMTHPANPDLPPSNPAAIKTLTAVAPDPFKDQAGYVRHAIAVGRAIESPGYRMDDATLGEFFLKAALRSYDPMGAGRQLAAARGAPDRRKGLQRLTMPTLVIHGTDDPIVPLAGGEELARNIAGSFLLTIDGMGHDLAPGLFDTFADAIALNTRRFKA